MLIKVSGGNSVMQGLLARQTPGRTMRWGDKTFFFNDDHDYCDWWFVLHFGGLTQTETVNCDPSHTVLVTMEPRAWGRPVPYCQQFASIVTCDSELNHPSLILRNGITWWAGINVDFKSGHVFSPSINQDFDGFMSMAPPLKKNRVSLITSLKTSFPGHKKRLRFVNRLRRHPIAEHIDFFGGHNPVQDKLQGLLDYKYHIAIENSRLPHYWSEKIADPYLAYSLPIYAGCPNVADYFPADSYLPIDLDDFDAAVETIRQCLYQDEHTRRMPAIREARNRVLMNYNIFELMASISERPAQSLVPCTLRPYTEFEPRRPVWIRGLKSLMRSFPLQRA